MLLVGHRAASFGGQLAALFRFPSARRGGVQRRALREAKGDGAAAALRRWMPLVVSMVRQQSLQRWREAFDERQKPGRKKRECELTLAKLACSAPLRPQQHLG